MLFNVLSNVTENVTSFLRPAAPVRLRPRPLSRPFTTCRHMHATQERASRHKHKILSSVIRPTHPPGTMAENSNSSSFSTASRSDGRITALNEHDVLFGRGLGSSQYIGSKCFRRLVEGRKEEYTSTKSYKQKAVIAKEIYHEIRARGGRFLILVATEKPARNVVESGVWKEADEKAALEKCKQSLREQRNDQDEDEDEEPNGDETLNHSQGNKEHEVDDSLEGSAGVPNEGPDGSEDGQSSSVPDEEGADEALKPNAIAETEALMSPSVASASTRSVFELGCASEEWDVRGLGSPTLASTRASTTPSPVVSPNMLIYAESPMLLTTRPSSLSPVIPPRMFESYRSSNVDTRYGFFQMTAQFGFQQQQSVTASPVVQHSEHSYQEPTSLTLTPAMYPTDSRRPSELSDNQVSTTSSPLTGQDDHDFSESFLCLFGIGSDQPRFSEEEEEIERATLTDEEKAAALCDLFGKYSISDTHENKRARKDLDRRSIDFLIQYMRFEIEQTPADTKQALIEAQAKCRPEEFNDERLERFLRCEGMNAKASVNCSWRQIR